LIDWCLTQTLAVVQLHVYRGVPLLIIARIAVFTQ